MKSNSRFVRILLSTAVAVLFVASPVVKFSAAGAEFGVGAVAFAQALPGDVPPDVVDPYAPPTGGGGGLVDPPTDPVDPPTDPVDPPLCEVNCDPDIVPIDPPVIDCEDTKEGCLPEPVALPTPAAQSSSDRDSVPASKPLDAKAEAMAFAKSLACIRPCSVTVMPNGDMTIRINDNQLQNSKGLIDVVFEIKGNVVTVKYVAEDEEVLVNSGKDWGSVAAARQQVAEWVGEV